MMMSELLIPFEFRFMQHAFLVGALIAVPAALLSCFLVLKGWALMGDAISHSVLPGVVVAYILGLPLALGAFAAGLTCALATGYIAEHSRIKRDTIMGVVFSGMFGLGIVLYAAIPTDIHLDHILFGNILGISTGDLWLAALVAFSVLVVVIIKWRDIMLFSFDPDHARTMGLPVSFMHYTLLAALSLTLVVILQAVGLILAISLVIAPGAIAFLMTKQFRSMLILSVMISQAFIFVGIYASFFINSAPAPTIVLVAAAMFILAYIARALHNLKSSSTSPSNAT